jgi:hypothetical protein
MGYHWAILGVVAYCVGSACGGDAVTVAVSAPTNASGI